MHDARVIHRDLKPENILLKSENNLNSLKIADFGLSTKYAEEITYQNYSQKYGTLLYMAPEQLAGNYSKPVDIWSCGIIMYQLFSMGKHPIYSGNESQ